MGLLLLWLLLLLLLLLMLCRYAAALFQAGVHVPTNMVSGQLFVLRYSDPQLASPPFEGFCNFLCLATRSELAQSLVQYSIAQSVRHPDAVGLANAVVRSAPWRLSRI